MNMRNGNPESLNNFLRELNKLCQKLDNKYDINSGGCCYVSYVIAQNLEKLNIRYKFVIFDRCDIYKEKSLVARKCIKNRDGNYTGNSTCNHYYIKVNGINVNQGRYTEKVNSVEIGCISSEDILYLVKSGHWNSYFNKHHKTIVRKEITKLFEKHEEEIRQISNAC